MAPQGSYIGDDRWTTLCERIEEGKATPVIGAGASAHILGTGGQVATEWGDAAGYPGPAGSPLPAIAQYVAVSQDHASASEYVEKLFRARLEGLSVADLPDRTDPYRVLPRLPFPVYVTTNYDDLLVRGLRAFNREPRVATVRWVPPDRQWTPADPDLEDFEPTVGQPLVFHLHGRYEDRSSMVISEADYLDFLTQMARGDLLPQVVREALARNALIFLGYSFSDVNVQLLLRAWTPLRRGMAVQPPPPLPDDRAADFLAYYPAYVKSITGHDLDMFWGTATDFCAELCRRCGGC